MALPVRLRSLAAPDAGHPAETPTRRQGPRAGGRGPGGPDPRAADRASQPGAKKSERRRRAAAVADEAIAPAAAESPVQNEAIAPAAEEPPLQNDATATTVDHPGRQDRATRPRPSHPLPFRTKPTHQASHNWSPQNEAIAGASVIPPREPEPMPRSGLPPERCRPCSSPPSPCSHRSPRPDARRPSRDRRASTVGIPTGPEGKALSRMPSGFPGH